MSKNNDYQHQVSYGGLKAGTNDSSVAKTAIITTGSTATIVGSVYAYAKGSNTKNSDNADTNPTNNSNNDSKSSSDSNCLIYSVLGLEYDNAILNHPTLLKQLWQQFDPSNVDKLINLNLSENELTEVIEFNAFTTLLGCNDSDNI